MPTDEILNLNILLELYGFPVTDRKEKSVKLVFHPTSEYDFFNDFRQNQIEKIEAYQREQGKHIFEKCTHIISFLQNGASRAVFFGIYRIDGHQILKNPPIEFSKNLPEKQWNAGAYWYDMTRLDNMSELRGRLVVDWGMASRAWHQWLRKNAPKKIVEIFPRSLQHDFPGFDDLCLPYSELQEMIGDQAAYRSWHDILQSVSGVYLILDTKSGKQYVGSACGDGGILGRWREYAKSGHGGNKELMDYTEADFPAFMFSILYVSKSPREVLRYESIFKEKLGTRKHGLNRN